jgi:Secretion system C-terminal sorting domain
MTTKNTLSLLGFLLLLSSLTYAQPVLQGNVVPNIGGKVFLASSDTNSVNVGNPGPNQIWNFSALAPLTPAEQYDYVSPVGTPYAQNYPTATLVTKWGTAPNISYAYQRKEANQFLILGVRGESFSLHYVDPDAQLKFPTSYNGTYQDNFSYNSDAGTGTVFLSTGSHSVKYDAYGTLTTPYGTFQNAMRIRATTIQTDSTAFPGAEIINHHNNITYDWLVANQPGALVSVTYFHTVTEARLVGLDTIITDSGITKTVNYISSSTVGVFDAPKPLAGLAAFSVGPNPAIDQLTLRFTSDLTTELQVSVTDISGKVWRTQSLTTIQGDNNLQLSVAELPAGAYFLTLVDGHSLQSWPWQKF